MVLANQYGLIFVLTTYFSWQQLPGAIALVILCFGDAAAEMYGRRYGRSHWPFPRGSPKTREGTAAFFMASLGACMAMGRNFADEGWTNRTGIYDLIIPSAIVCAAAAGLELLSPGRWDNIIVFAGSYPLAILLLS